MSDNGDRGRPGSMAVMHEVQAMCARGRFDAGLLRRAAGELRADVDDLILSAGDYDDETRAEIATLEGDAQTLEMAAFAADLDASREAALASAVELAATLYAALESAQAALSEHEALDRKMRAALEKLTVDLARERGQMEGTIAALEASARPRAVRVVRDDAGRAVGYEQVEVLVEQ